MKTLAPTLLAFMMGAAPAVHANTDTKDIGNDDPRVQWRLVGSGYSRHSNQTDGRIEVPAYGVQQCTEEAGGTRCTRRVVAARRGYESHNLGFGIQRLTASADAPSRMDIVFASALRDSYDQPGLMIGWGRTWPIADWGGFSLDAGVAAGLWYRTTIKGEAPAGRVTYCPPGSQPNAASCPASANELYLETVLQRKIVPFVLPLASINERRTRLGLNLSFLPRYRMDQRTSPATLMVQLTYRIAF